MNRFFFIMLFSIVLLVGLMMMLGESSSRKTITNVGTGPEVEPLLLFCAASNRAVMEAIRKEYEADFGFPIEIQYGPSQTLLASVEVTGTGDLYVPADDSFLETGREKGLVQEIIPLANMRLGAAVLKGNPKGIQSLADLMKDGIRLVQANTDAAAVAKQTKKILQKSGQWDAFDKATAGYRSTVTDVANDVRVNAADVGIVYDAVLSTYPELEFVEIPEFESGTANIAAGVLSSSKRPTAALHFARYLAARDRGQLKYAEFGFNVVNGDPWADVPELSIYAGSMLQPAIEKSIVEFEEREGVAVSRVYNGCGILVAQMQAGQQPDAYFACDVEFMQQVKEKFGDPIDVSQNELVILVEKGNPFDVKSLKDLTKEGLRVGIGHEKQCAMGWLTQQTFTEAGIQEELMKNVTTQTPTGDMLVNQLKTGSLDAAVVYLSNAAGSGDKFDAIRIKGIECAQATQPFAIAQESRYSQLAARLFAKLQTAESKQRFLENGFVWNGK